MLKEQQLNKNRQYYSTNLQIMTCVNVNRFIICQSVGMSDIFSEFCKKLYYKRFVILMVWFFRCLV